MRLYWHSWRSIMAPDVVSATYKGKYKIEITFEDGKKGIVDFSKYLDKGGVFSRFRDINFFKSFKVNSELGVLSWGDEVDVAPETLYSEATGTSLPNWMKEDGAFGKQKAAADG
jgi:Protein of unknown function (DUF2442)